MATTNGQGGVAGLWRTLGDYGQRRYAGSSASTPLRVTEVQRDSNEAIVQVFGTIDGVGRFAVPLRGAEAAVGDTLLVAYPRDAPVGADLTYVRHLAAAAGGGIVAVDPNLPVPVFDDPFYTTQMDVNYGGAVARATIYWLAVEEKFRPTGYTISYNINAYSDGTWVRGTWIDQYVPHLGGAQSAQLSASIPPGNQVEVRLRARYAWAAAESLETETRAFLGAVDTTPVVPAVGLTIDNSVPNSLLLTAQAGLNFDVDRFLGWIYTVANNPAGTGATDSAPIPGPMQYYGPPGTYYVRVRPRYKDGREGAPYPPTGFATGTIISQDAAEDHTPPPPWPAPGVTMAPYATADGVQHPYGTLTLPTGYAYPADYAETTIKVRNATLGTVAFYTVPLGQTAYSAEWGWGDLYFSLRGVDTHGNVQPGFGPETYVANPKVAVPGAAPSISGMSVALGVLAEWTAVANSLGYELERSTDSAGSWATTLTRTEALRFVDGLFDQTVVLPTYWYRVRAYNGVGTGPWSSRIAVQIGALDGVNIKADTVTAQQILGDQAFFNEVMAGKILSDVIKTAASGARWELTGANGGPNAGTLRWYNASNTLKLDLNQGGLAIANDGGFMRAAFLGDVIYFFQDNNNLARAAFVGDGLYFYQNDGSKYRAVLNTSGLYLYQDDGTTIRTEVSTTGLIVYNDSKTKNAALVRSGNTIGLNVDAARVLLYDNQAIIRPDNSYAFSVNPHYNLTPQAGSVTFQTLYRASTWWQGIMGDFIFGGNIAGGGTPANYVHFRPDGNLGFGNGSGVESAYLGLDGWGTAGMVSNDFHVRRMYVTYPWGQPGPGYLAQYSAILRSNDLQTVVNAASAALALVAVGGNSSNLRFDCYRSVAGSAWMDTRWRIQSEIDNYGAAGGNLALGYTGSGGMWGLGVGGAYNLYYNPATNQIVAGVFISKAGGGFQIPHPDPAKRSEQRDGGLAVHEEAVDLRHGFVETDTRGDNLYRRVISADEETGGGSYRGRLALPDWWPLINESPQVFVSPRKHFGRAYGEIAADGRSVEISALDPGEYNVLIVGTRSDQQAREWWDATGGAEPRAMTHPDRV